MTVTLPDREIWQNDVLEYLVDNPTNKWVVTKSVRQVGKSTLAQMLLVYASVKYPSSKSISISPVVAQARKLYDEIVSWAKPIIKKSNATQLSIKFINGSQVLFKSGEQADSIRGETVKRGGILVIDEAAYLKDDFFYSILVPLTNVYRSDIFIFSTPRFQKGFFYELFQQGMAGDEKVVSFDWTNYDTSKFLPAETLEIYRRQMPKLAFQCEFLGQFISGEGQVFSSFRECIGEGREDTSKEMYIGVDWGTGQGSDSTVLTCGQVIDGIINISKVHAFNDKSAQEQIDYIRGVVVNYVNKGWKEIKIMVEHNSIGQVYYELLRAEIDKLDEHYNGAVDIKLKQFTTTNASKKKIVEQLVTLLEQRKIVIPDLDKFLNELSQFEAKVNELGTVLYRGANGGHDDYVLSCCFCCDMMYKQVIKGE